MGFSYTPPKNAVAKSATAGKRSAEADPAAAEEEAEESSGTARGGSMARGGAAQACARVVPRLVADVVVREGAQWCTLTSQLVFRSVCEWSGVFFRGSSTLGKGDN